MRQQPEADRAGDAQLPQRHQLAPLGRRAVVDRVVGAHAAPPLHRAGADLQRDQFRRHPASWACRLLESTTRSTTTAEYAVISGFLCPSDQDRLTEPTATTITWPTPARRRTATTAATPTAPVLERPGGRAVHLLVERHRHRPPRIRRQFRQLRRHHRRHEQHGRVQRARQGDRHQHLGRHRHRSTRASPRRRSRRRRPVANNLEGSRRPITRSACRTPPEPGERQPGSRPTSMTTISRERSGSRASRRTPDIVHVMPPNTWSCRTGSRSPRASSHHPGGVNVLFCDGSVKAIKSTISVNTWWALGTRAGGEVISSDQY